MKSIIRYILLKIKFSKAKVSYSSRVSLNTVLGEHVRILPNCDVGDCQISSFTYLGINCRFERTSIGSFTSIGPDVLCGLASHPLDQVSTYPGFYTKNASGAVWLGNTQDAFKDKHEVTIGSDVWIGARSIILGGISIGHGAIIGAGSIVTKDIPPYAIAAGVPAKIIRYRFENSIILKLIESQWWTYSLETLRTLAPHMKDPKLFLEQLELLKDKVN